MTDDWDAVVVGGGAAGLSAAQLLGRSRRRTLVIDGGSPRNRVAAHLHGLLGHDCADPARLLETGREEARRYGVAFAAAEVAALDDHGDRIRVTRADGSVDTARAVVLATGVRDDLPDVPGLREEWGRGVLHCPYCHGWEVAGQRLAVLATGDASLHQAQLVRQLSDDVTVFTAAIEPLHEEDAVRLTARGIRIVREPVAGLRRTADGLVLTTAGGAHPVDAVFTGGVPVVELGYAAGLRLHRTAAPGSPVAVDATGATSRARVFAAGNITAPFGDLAVSTASGSTAGAGLNAALVAEDVELAVAARTARRNGDWEERYATRDRFWSGGVNATVASIVAAFPPGRALDVGSGEGSDVVWLAERGWRATGVDVSGTAVRRAAGLARSRGVDADFRAGDGAASVDGEFDLVLSSFLHSWEPDFPRIRLLRDAAARVAPGGRLLVVSHASVPAGAKELHEHAPLLRSPQEELALLDLDPAAWTAELVEVRAREAAAPDGTTVALDDGVLLLRRVE